MNFSLRELNLFKFMFEDLIRSDKCSGLESEVENRLSRITEQWEFLVNKSSEKSLKLKEASKQQTFNAGVKDIEFWLGLVENQLKNEEYGKDLAGAQNSLKKHQLIEADVLAHEEQIKELNGTADQFINNNLFETDNIVSTIRNINNRYELMKSSVLQRRERLHEANTLFQILRDLDDEEAWIKEKKLQVGSQDYGRDLTSNIDFSLFSLEKNLRFEIQLALRQDKSKALRFCAQSFALNLGFSN